MSNESIILGGRGAWRGVERRGGEGRIRPSSSADRRRRGMRGGSKPQSFRPLPVSALPNLCLASIPFIIKKTEGDGSGTKRSGGAVDREAPADTGKPSTHLPRGAKKRTK